MEASRAVTGEPMYTPSLWYYDLFHFISEDQDEEENFEQQDDDLAVVSAEFESDMQYESDDFDDEVRSFHTVFGFKYLASDVYNLH